MGEGRGEEGDPPATRRSEEDGLTGCAGLVCGWRGRGGGAGGLRGCEAAAGGAAVGAWRRPSFLHPPGPQTTSPVYARRRSGKFVLTVEWWRGGRGHNRGLPSPPSPCRMGGGRCAVGLMRKTAPCTLTHAQRLRCVRRSLAGGLFTAPGRQDDVTLGGESRAGGSTTQEYLPFFCPLKAFKPGGGWGDVSTPASSGQLACSVCSEGPERAIGNWA